MAGFRLTPSNDQTEVDESGTEDTIEFVLTARPQQNVIVNIDVADATELSVTPQLHTVTAANWNVPFTVTVTGLADDIIDGDQQTQIQFSISADSDPAFATLESQGITATTLDVVDFSLDTDADNQFQPLTDGILIIRYLSGFSGAALIEDAIAGNGQRRSSAEIVDYLDSNRTTLLDVDGDGISQSLTDGILIIRYLAGFQGTTLTDGAIGPGAVRTTPEEISGWLDALVGQSGSGAGGGSASGNSEAANSIRQPLPGYSDQTISDTDDLFGDPFSLFGLGW